MKKEFLVTAYLDEEVKNQLKKDFNQINFTFIKNKDLKEEDMKNKEVIIGNPSLELLKKATNLKWIQLQSSGVGDYAKEGSLPDNTVLSSATGAFGPSVAEHGFAMLLSILKKLNLYRDNQNKNIWRKEGPSSSLFNKKVLILGLGDIGTNFAKMVAPFTGDIIGFNHSGRENDFLKKVYSIKHLDEHLPTADVIFMALPDTKETRNLMSKERISSLKKDAVLINVGRGTAVDTNALYTALKENKIFGAGLDVTDPEPLKEDHPLWSLKNAVITPHISGSFDTDVTLHLFLELLYSNINSYLNNNNLKSLVKKGDEYAR